MIHFLLVLLVSSTSFAGGSLGGGGWKLSEVKFSPNSANSAQVVYFVNMNQDLISFKLAELDLKTLKWTIRNQTLHRDQLTQTELEALEVSFETQNWSRILR